MKKIDLIQLMRGAIVLNALAETMTDEKAKADTKGIVEIIGNAVDELGNNEVLEALEELCDKKWWDDATDNQHPGLESWEKARAIIAKHRMPLVIMDMATGEATRHES